jgi:hypothetical protein
MIFFIVSVSVVWGIGLFHWLEIFYQEFSLAAYNY